MRAITAAFLLSATLGSAFARLPSNLPRVTLTQGTFVGNLTKPSTVFFGNIPYAEPPLGDLRFRKPVKHHTEAEGQRVLSLPDLTVYLCTQFTLRLHGRIRCAKFRQLLSSATCIYRCWVRRLWVALKDSNDLDLTYDWSILIRSYPECLDACERNRNRSPASPCVCPSTSSLIFIPVRSALDTFTVEASIMILRYKIKWGI
jgi:hypothetical protein